MKKIKIVYFVSGLKAGGVEQMLINYCNRMNKDIFEFVIIYQHKPVQICLERLMQIGCKTERITARSENLLKNVKDTYHIIKKYNPDIVHSNMNLMNFIPNVIAKCLGVKIRISHSHIAEKGKNVIYYLFKWICQKLIICSSNVFLSCGKEAGTYLHGNRVSSVIIHNAIELDLFNEACNNITRNAHLIGKTVIGHAGRFSLQKNHKKLIDIFTAFKEKKSNAILLLAGTGELEDSIKNYVKEMHLEKSVFFLGAVSNMKEFYANLDLFLLPSLFEGFPVVALETQAAGVYSIFSDTIDPDVKITELINLMPISDTDKDWADKMLYILNLKKEKTNKGEYLNQLRTAGYDIKYEALKLQDIYLQSIERFNIRKKDS